MSQRDKRALILLGAIAVVIIGWSLGSGGSDTPEPVVPVEDIPTAERRLARLRQVAAAVPGRQTALAAVSSELAGREKGLISAETPAQAQAQILQILVKLGRKQQPAIDMKNTEIGTVKPAGDAYGEVSVSVNFESGIDQLLNFLADITAQKELIATSDLRIGQAHPKTKSMPVRLTVSGLVRRDLLPHRKAGAL